MSYLAAVDSKFAIETFSGNNEYCYIAASDMQFNNTRIRHCCISTATTVTLTRYNVTSYVHCLSRCFQNRPNPFTATKDLSQKDVLQLMTYIITLFSALSCFLLPIDLSILLNTLTSVPSSERKAIFLYKTSKICSFTTRCSKLCVNYCCWSCNFQIQINILNIDLWKDLDCIIVAQDKEN